MKRQVQWAMQKVYHRLQRMTVQVVIGILFVLSSHWVPRDDERGWLRDSGTGIVVFAVTKWLADQHGHRRENQRHPTIRFRPPKDD